MARSAPFLLALCTALSLGTPPSGAEDDLSAACSAVFHKTTPNGESLRFRFKYAGNDRFRQLLTGDSTRYMREALLQPAPRTSPSFSCVLVFTAPPATHRPQDTRILVRVSDLHLGSSGCGPAADAVRVYSVLRGRLFLVREFCGNDNYAPAIITESHMAIVTVNLFGSTIEQETRRFHLNVEAYKDIFKSTSHSKPSVPYVPEVANINMYELMQQQQEKQDYGWNEISNQYSDWGTSIEYGNNWMNTLPNGGDTWNVYIPNERWKRLALFRNQTVKV